MKDTIAVIGTGYVGLTSGVCFAKLGFCVVCHDIDSKKIAMLIKGKTPFYEPGLQEALTRYLQQKQLTFTTHIERALKDSRFIFICVGTPPRKGGGVDLRAYNAALVCVKNALKKSIAHGDIFIINKSTVPVGTASRVQDFFRNSGLLRTVHIVSNPEFLREGRAVTDFMEPDRIVIGVGNTAQKKNVQPFVSLYQSLRAPKLVVGWETAEMIKYASNAFLATKISFINEIANVCERVGADVEEVARGMGYDPRIGAGFLRAGIGYGGSCFPKDVRALHHMARSSAYSFKLLKAVIEVNNDQQKHAVEKIIRALHGAIRGKTIAILGLAFKPQTDDVRESASLAIIKALLKKGARIRAYDPQAQDNARAALSGLRGVTLCADAYEATRGAHALFLATEWKEFQDLDWEKIKVLMKGNAVIDGRNALNAKLLERNGFTYVGFGVH